MSRRRFSSRSSGRSSRPLPDPEFGAFAERHWSPPGGGVDHGAERSADGRCFARRLEFDEGREAIRRAGVELGVELLSLGVDTSGAPQWPDGIVGSLTHCQGYAAAVVARADDLRAIGIDAEPWRPLDPRTLAYISTVAESRQVAALTMAQSGVPWCRILFTVKEAAYKAVSALGRTVTFSQVEVEFSHDRFTVICDARGAPMLLEGRWARRARGRVVTTAVWITRERVPYRPADVELS